MEEFLKACGATGPLQLVIEHRDLIAMRWGAHQPFALIGRDPAADVSLDHPRVDPYHAYLQVIDGGVYWVDLESQAGTRWQNGTTRSGWLVPPHGIGIGPYIIRLVSDDLEDEGGSRRPDPLASRSQASDGLTRIMLEFRQESSRPVRWRMRHLLTLVGSSALCKVRLSSPGVRPFHCSLLRTAAGLWMVNLLGPEGVKVNGSGVRAARLQDGDELRIADVLVRVLFLDEAAASGGTPALEGAVRKSLAAPSPPAASATGLAPRRPQAAWMAPGPEAEGLLPGQVPGQLPGPIPVQVQVQGTAPGEGEIPASMLALVLDQFGQMQQQFLDQFQQTTLMMFRALGSMHRDQMEELREKLDSLHQIGENLQAFQEQLEGGAAAGALPAITGAASASPPNRAPAGPAQETPPAAPARAPSPSAAANSVEQLREKVRLIVDQPGIPGEDVHEWLIGRIAAIEDEQRTRWQKILDMVRGR